VQGIGLGLVISKQIVTQFDGIIDFISDGTNQGATFFYTFKTDMVTEIDLSSFESELIIASSSKTS
jgi:signal transduction histidine kinase